MQFVDTLDYHIRNPGESAESYVRRKSISLAREMRPRTKIYLDTNYWLILRDVRLGRTASQEAIQLLRRLEQLVEEGAVVCPLSVDTYAEVNKQTVPETVRATLRLIDDLSLGMTLVEMDTRLNTETMHFIREKSAGSEAVHPLGDLVWTKACYVLGFSMPVFPKLDPAFAEAMQKAMIDQMWVAKLEDMLDVMGPEMHGKDGWYPSDIAQTLNAGKQAHTHEYTSFKDLFLNELAGVLDLRRPSFEEIASHLYTADTGKPSTPSPDEREASGRMIANCLYNVFRLNKVKAELPTFRIMSTLHAAMRWDASRKWKANDLHDLHHAASALAYCDLFFTENPLRELVSGKHCGFASFFPCKAISSVEEANKAIAELDGRRKT